MITNGRIDLASIPPELEATVHGMPMLLTVRRFNTGSIGWHGQCKVKVGEHKVQVNLLCTVVGSKPAAAVVPTSEQMNNKPAKAPRKPAKPSEPEKGTDASPIFPSDS